jgi:citrate/tricarballylate utilization protein
MPSPTETTPSESEDVEEARRLMVICNACRYCEGFCAVFPAMERRSAFHRGDLMYLANLCHDCRGCYYACPYTPPHEFAVNVPRTLARLRGETYRLAAWPERLGVLFQRNGFAVGLIVALASVMVIALTLALAQPSVVFATHTGDGAFYRVVPYWLMVLPASAMAVYAVVALLVGGVRFWRESGGSPHGPPGATALWGAARDAARMTYLGGGGHGCNYPAERFSQRRKWFHHMVFYGFLLDFLSTTVAAFYEHVLHLQAPYPLSSLPVVLGTLGGVGLLAGTSGLLWLRRGNDPDPSESSSSGMDVAFLWLLLLTSLSGLLLLALRETPAMGSLLAVHLGIVAGLFLTLPYSKFVHGIYRYLALVRNSMEESVEQAVES